MKSPIDGVVGYVKESREELRKVTWPSRSQTQNYTLVVIGLSVFTMVFFSILDYVFDLGINVLSTFTF